MKNKKQKDYTEYIESHITECDISYRGGKVKIDVSELFGELPAEECAVMGAYQNYLGGGIAGAIIGGAMFEPALLSKKNQAVFEELLEAIKEWFYVQNQGGGDEYMVETGNKGYAENQKRAKSGY